ncbi:UbiX family flavin prenyltransferase [bacterium]|nr:MAG: UbiX family flavin prenyltransferase [bacterium]
MNRHSGAIIIAITGASGSIYGLRLTEEALRAGREVDLVVSEPGYYVMETECGIRLTGDPDKDRNSLLDRVGKGTLRIHSNRDLTSPLSSGSSLGPDMVVAPCTMGTAGRIARGVSTCLIDRAADVTLKENRRLILLPRETPLNAVHLENLLTLSRAGAVILPPMPGFYHHPESIDDMVDFVVGKVLDVLEIEHELFKRWG